MLLRVDFEKLITNLFPRAPCQTCTSERLPVQAYASWWRCIAQFCQRNETSLECIPIRARWFDGSAKACKISIFLKFCVYVKYGPLIEHWLWFCEHFLCLAHGERHNHALGQLVSTVGGAKWRNPNICARKLRFFRPCHLLLDDFLSNVTAIERDTATNFLPISSKLPTNLSPQIPGLSKSMNKTRPSALHTIVMLIEHAECLLKNTDPLPDGFAM